MRPIVVLGAIRSGTSLVAAGLHQLGVPMGVVAMPFPTPGSHPEYEDVPLVHRLTRKALGEDVPELDTVSWWRSYARARAHHARSLGRATWGVKSPLLLLDPTLWLHAWREPYTVLCRRSPEDARDSLRRLVLTPSQREKLLALQAKTQKASESFRPEVSVEWADMQRDPQDVLERILYGHPEGEKLWPGATRVARALEVLGGCSA